MCVHNPSRVKVGNLADYVVVQELSVEQAAMRDCPRTV